MKELPDSQLDALLSHQPVKADARLRQKVMAEIASGHAGDKADLMVDRMLAGKPVSVRPGLSFRIRARLKEEKQGPVQPLWKWVAAASGLAAAIVFSVVALDQPPPEREPFSPLAELEAANKNLNVDNVESDQELVRIMALASQMPDNKTLKLDETGVEAISLFLE